MTVMPKVCPKILLKLFAQLTRRYLVNLRRREMPVNVNTTISPMALTMVPGSTQKRLLLREQSRQEDGEVWFQAHLRVSEKEYMSFSFLDSSLLGEYRKENSHL